MFKIISGNVNHARDTMRILGVVGRYVDQQNAIGASIRLADIVALSGFAYPVKGDYRIHFDGMFAPGAEQQPDVFNGQTSYIDWIKTINNRMVVVMGLEPVSFNKQPIAV